MLTQSHVVVESDAFAGMGRMESIPLSADEHHGTRRGHEIRGVDAVSFFFLVHYTADVGRHIVVGRALAEHAAQVMIFFAEEAGSQLSIGGQANARAMSTEGLRH